MKTLNSWINFNGNTEEADKIFASLSSGGEVEGAMGDSPWGTYAGMFRDKFGIEWIIEFTSE